MGTDLKLSLGMGVLAREQCENTGLTIALQEIPTMDAEQINAIGSKLTDLAARTLDLRGYL